MSFLPQLSSSLHYTNKCLKLWKLDSFTPHPPFFKPGSVQFEQTQLWSPLGQNKKYGGKTEGRFGLEDTQGLHIHPQSFQNAVEAAWSRGFSIPGLVDVVGGK